MRTHVRFYTSLFKPPDEQENQYENGLALAVWLVEKLKDEGYPSADHIPEDWGQRILFPQPLWLGCGYVDEGQWLVFCEAQRSLIDRILRRFPCEVQQNELIRAIQRIVDNEPSFKDSEWFESDRNGREFNHGRTAE